MLTKIKPMKAKKTTLSKGKKSQEKREVEAKFMAKASWRIFSKKSRTKKAKEALKNAKRKNEAA